MRFAALVLLAVTLLIFVYWFSFHASSHLDLSL
ncbi:DUF5993 family protein [Polynucleobacter meluiroseus]